MPSKIQLLFADHEAKAARLVEDELSCAEADQLIRDLIEVSKTIMEQIPEITDDIGIMAHIVEYWRQGDDDEASLEGFELKLSRAVAAFFNRGFEVQT